MKHKPKIIIFLSKYWISKGVWFGDIIHELKPKDQEEWIEFLKAKKWYLLNFKHLRKHGNIRKKEIPQWCAYLKNAFWKLYVSETIAINHYKNNNIDLERVDKAIDIKYAIDYKYKTNDKTHFVIVKNGTTRDKLFALISVKQLDFFNFEGFNLNNSTIELFDSLTRQTYLFNVNKSAFELITNN